MLPARPARDDQYLPGPAGTGAPASTGTEEPAFLEEPALLEEPDTAGDPACLAHLVCPACGAVTTEGHQPGCDLERLTDD